MDIYTDASLNDQKKIAGIGLVFVDSPHEPSPRCWNAYFSIDNIETAELFAVSAAISHAVSYHPNVVRLFSDSTGALRKIQRIFQYPSQRQIQTITNPLQQKIMYHISTSFEMMQDSDFSFHCIRGHQPKPVEFSYGYYNMLADRAAADGRLLGEMISASTTSSLKIDLEKTKIQMSKIVSPSHISFHYEDLGNKPKLVVKSKNHKKARIIKRAARSKYAHLR